MNGLSNEGFFALVLFVTFGTYFAGWLHGRGTSYWTLRGYSSRALRREIEKRERFGDPP